MRVIKQFMGFVLLTVLCLLCGCHHEKEATKTEVPTVTGIFDFTILKAGQADAIIMQTKNHNIIIDCGEKDDGDEVVEYLQTHHIEKVDYLFITHFDKDHVGGFTEVIKNVAVKNIIVPDYQGNNREYDDYLNIIKSNNLSVTTLTEETVFTIDDVLVEVSIPKKQFYAEGDNDFSLVVAMTHGENTFLFAGDAETDRLPEVLSEFGREYDFLKVPHHGNHNKNTRRFIRTIKPRYAVITDSEKNPASPKTTSLLDKEGTEIYSTKNGDVSVISNGMEIKISQS